MVDPIPVSRPPAPNWTPEVPNDPLQLGKRHGTQSRATWRTGDAARKQVIDSVLAESLWRISVEGIGGLVLIDVEYGTSARRQILGIQSPMVLAAPGIVQVYVRPDNPGHEGMECRVTLTPATAGGIAQCRKVIDARVAPVAFDDGAVRFVALLASTAEVFGVVTPVAALAAVPVVQGSILNAGVGFQEFEA